MSSRSLGRRAMAATLLAWGACSPAGTPVKASAVGPAVVLDADSTSRSFVVHPCYETPTRLSSVRLTIDAEARATSRGDVDPWVRIFVESTREDEEPPDLVDGRISPEGPRVLSLEHWLEETEFFHSETDEDRSWLCDDGLAVVTFELVDPSGASRVEIAWDVSVDSSVFTEPEAFDVRVEG